MSDNKNSSQKDVCGGRIGWSGKNGYPCDSYEASGYALFHFFNK